MRYIKLFLFILVIVLISNIISAIPIITINSPENISYDSQKVSINITSNEIVDFFFKNLRTGKDILLAENVTELNDYLYVKNGAHKFIIWANNSNGVVNNTVEFSSTVSNPINISSGGYLFSSDTSYILSGDILPAGLMIFNLRNISFNLNGYTMGELQIIYDSDIKVYNGTLNSSDVTMGHGTRPWMLELEGSKMIFSNMNITGHFGIVAYPLIKDIRFENVKINSSLGFWYESTSDIYFINSSFTWNGYGVSYPCAATAFCDQSTGSKIILQETNITGFPYNFYIEGAYSDIYLRNSNINMSKIHYPDWTSNVRFLKQHLVIINISDQFGLTGACSVRIMDNGILPRKEGIDNEFETYVNPTGKIFVPTGETGTGETWLTEKLTIAKTSSPVEITEYDFSNYTLVTRGWGSDNYSTIYLNLTGINSTIYVNFPITTGLQREELPKCTIIQMLDLNNDGFVNIQDAVIILRKISGLSVSEMNESKQCEGINLNPF
jgi:hypothetical protein